MHFRLWPIIVALTSGLATASNVIISPNMGMPVPVVGQEPGPDWANDINASLSIIDSHDHTPGYGVQVPPAGLNINSDLTFQSNNATNLRTTRFTAQGSPLSGAGADVGALYVAGVDLYYNDESGNQVRITQGGSVTGSTGTITGLPSGTASASFSGSTFTFQAATNTPAIMAVGPVTIGTHAVSPKTVTIAPPGGLAANYNLTTFNGLPASTSLVTLDSSGQLAATTTLAVGNGSAAAPSITFASDTDTGLYNYNPNAIGFATGGAYRALISNAEADFGGVTNGVYFPDGTAAVPSISFSSDGDTGLYKFGTNALGIAAGGSVVAIIQASEADFSSTATLVAPSGSSSVPGLTIGGGGDTGVYRTSNTVGIATTGGSRMTINSTSLATSVPVSITGTGGNTPHGCTIRSNTTVITNPNTVTCSAGEIVTGGGCDMPNPSFSVTTSIPSASNIWECKYTTSGSVTNTAYAICCSI